MAWTCNWNTAAIDPLDAAYWDELYAALSERRTAAGLSRSAAFRQPRRAPAWGLVAPRRHNTSQEAWEALLAAVRELAPLFYWPDALADNAQIRTTADPDRAGYPSPLSPIPPTVDAWLPALAEPCVAMPPRSDAARTALRSVHDALDRMRWLKLSPVAAGGGVGASTPAGLARVLASNALVDKDGARSRPAAGGDIVARQYTGTRWVCECDEVFDVFDTGPFEVYAAYPYLDQQVSWFRAELVCYAPIGGTVRAHFVSDTATRSHASWNGGKNSWSRGPFDPGYVHADLDYALGTLLGQESGPDGMSSVAGAAAGWATLGAVAPNSVGIFLADSIPGALPADVSDDYATVVADHWPQGAPAGNALYTHFRTGQERTWRIDAAYIDLTSRLDKLSSQQE